VWATVPILREGYLYLALFLASLGVAAGALRLALAAFPVPEDVYLLTAAMQFLHKSLRILRMAPWEEGTTVAVLWLEVLHPARPWHTAVLGAALIAYLLATHLAESGTSPGVFRPYARVLALGAVLLALGAGAAMVPTVGPGSGSLLLRLVAAGALIAAAVLVLPYVARGEAPGPGRYPPAPIRGSQITPRDRRPHHRGS
jgi:hypothetical protein